MSPKIVCSDYIALKKIVLKTDSWLVSPNLDMFMDREMDDGELIALNLGQVELKNNLSTIELADRSRSPAAQKCVNTTSSKCPCRLSHTTESEWLPTGMVPKTQQPQNNSHYN